MSIFGYMKVHCPICKGEMDGMHAYGREARCCDKECFEEWQWRETLAIMRKEYYPRNRSERPGQRSRRAGTSTDLRMGRARCATSSATKPWRCCGSWSGKVWHMIGLVSRGSRASCVTVGSPYTVLAAASPPSSPVTRNPRRFREATRRVLPLPATSRECLGVRRPTF